MNATDLHIGHEPQLFVDNGVIECIQGVTRIWHKPQRHDEAPLIRNDRPWERLLYFTYSNYVVLHDPADGLIKCWYEDLGDVDPNNKGGQRHPWKSRLLYAESIDGIHFSKPPLDVVSIDGQPTNIVMGYEDGATGPTERNPWADVGVHSNGIIIDPHPPRREERFRTIFTRQSINEKGHLQHRLECAHSADGIHWTPYPKVPEAGGGRALDDVCCLHYDEHARLFVLNTRHGQMYASAEPPRTPFGGYWFPPYFPDRPDLMNKRRVFQTVSADFLNWRNPLPVSTPDDVIDNLDEAHYGMQQFHVGRHHFGTLGVFQYTEGKMEVRLLHGRDGVHFQPADRGNAFLKPREGHWDAHMVSITCPPVEKDGEWLFYHGGTSAHHDWWMDGSLAGVPESDEPNAYAKFGLGLARLRKEGIASLRANAERGGYVLTHPLKSPGNRLVINARCRPGGSIRAAVLDQDNQPVVPCTLETSDPFTGDGTGHVMTWKGTGSLSITPHGWRKIHFVLRDAEIFSFRLVSVRADDISIKTEFLHGTRT